MPRKRQSLPVYPPGLEGFLVDEAERLMAKRGEAAFPAIVRECVWEIAGFVVNPERLRQKPSRPLWTKVYSRAPETFLELALHLTRVYHRTGAILLALRESPMITFRDRGDTVCKPINLATDDEVAAYVRERFGLKKVEAKAVAMAWRRLAIKDSQLPRDKISMRQALEIFTRTMVGESRRRQIPVPPEE